MTSFALGVGRPEKFECSLPLSMFSRPKDRGPSRNVGFPNSPGQLSWRARNDLRDFLEVNLRGITAYP